MTTIGLVKEMLRIIIEMLKPLTTVISICYYINQLSSFLQVWAHFRVPKVFMIMIKILVKAQPVYQKWYNYISYNMGTCNCLIYMLAPSGLWPLGLGLYIR